MLLIMHSSWLHKKGKDAQSRYVKLRANKLASRGVTEKMWSKSINAVQQRYAIVKVFYSR